MAVGSPKIEELRARLQGDPKSRMFLPLAEELRKAGHLEEAERVLNQGISAHPSYLSAWVSLGRVLLARGNPNGAADAANRALKIDPENIVAARVCADAYLAAGEKVEAIKKYKLVHAFLPTDLEIQAHIEELDRELNPESHIRPIAVSQEASPEFNVLEQTEPVPSAEAVDLAETRAMPQVSLPWEETAPESPAEYETSSDQQAPSGPSGANDLAEEARTFLEAAFAQPATDEDDEDTLSKRPRPAESAFTDAEAPEMWTPMQDGSEEEGSSDSFEELSEPPSYLSEPMRAADVAAPEWEPLPPEAAPIPPVEDFAETLQEPEPEIEPEPQEDLAVASEEPAPLVDAAALAETQYIQPVPEPETANRATIARLEGWLRVIRKVDE